jgi:lytic cellulose monooxygenase (C1-hydroxylating)
MNPKPNSPAWTGPGYGQGGVPPDKFAVVKFLTLLLCKVRRRLITIIQSNIICHDDAKPGNVNVEVNTGSTIRIQWTKWADTHHGPVIDYLAPCVGPCTSASPQSLKFTKIAESGLVKAGPPTSYVFATDVMIKNNNTWTVKIPTGLKSGEYVLRNEIIALHTAGTVGGAQNYPQCFNLKVIGGGQLTLPPGAPGTSLYKPQTPGIVFNIAATIQRYPIPGPPLWKSVDT